MAHGAVENFTIAVPDEVLTDLRERLARTRLPGEVRDSGWTYGTNLAYLKELIEYWRTRYDWRKHERELNALRHYKVTINDCPIHFIHQPGAGPNPTPLLLLHGWPGSIAEFQQIIPMLTDPARHGRDARDSFTVVAPSLPGYGFSDDPHVPGMKVEPIADIFHELMTQVLGYPRFGAQGGDWGAIIASRVGHAHAKDVIGVHLNMVALGPHEGRKALSGDAESKRFLEEMARFGAEETGYQQIQGTKPQTLAYALNDSPAGLAAWIVEKFRTWSDCGGNVESRFTKDQLLTNITIYWVTQSINSSTRLYYEVRHSPFRLGPGERVEAPTGIALFPGELIKPPRAYAEKAYNIQRWTPMPRGGHFAAMEEPALLADEIRAFFREVGRA
jgi:pimeloyl-ACP methyl ester carboxylesterase